MTNARKGMRLPALAGLVLLCGLPPALPFCASPTQMAVGAGRGTGAARHRRPPTVVHCMKVMTMEGKEGAKMSKRTEWCGHVTGA